MQIKNVKKANRIYINRHMWHSYKRLPSLLGVFKQIYDSCLQAIKQLLINYIYCCFSLVCCALILPLCHCVLLQQCLFCCLMSVLNMNQTHSNWIHQITATGSALLFTITLSTLNCFSSFLSVFPDFFLVVQVTDLSVRAVAEHCPELQFVGFMGCPVTSQGVIHLTAVSFKPVLHLDYHTNLKLSVEVHCIFRTLLVWLLISWR